MGRFALASLRETGENSYEVLIDGKALHVDVTKTARTIYSVIEDGRQFEVVVERIVVEAPPSIGDR